MVKGSEELVGVSTIIVKVCSEQMQHSAIDDRWLSSCNAERKPGLGEVS